MTAAAALRPLPAPRRPAPAVALHDLADQLARLRPDPRDLWRFYEQRSEAEAGADAAEAAVAEAKSKFTAAMTKAAAAGKPPPASTTKAARDRLHDALDALDAARETHATLAGRVNPLHEELHRAKLILDHARAAALRPAGLRLADEIEALRADTTRKLAALAVLRSKGAFSGPPSVFGGQAAFSRNNTEAQRIAIFWRT